MTDPDLQRLLEAARAGARGVDLSQMSDEEIVRRLAIAGEAQRGETVKLGSTGTASTRADRHRPNSGGHLLHKRSD